MSVEQHLKATFVLLIASSFTFGEQPSATQARVDDILNGVQALTRDLGVGIPALDGVQESSDRSHSNPFAAARKTSPSAKSLVLATADGYSVRTGPGGIDIEIDGRKIPLGSTSPDAAGRLNKALAIAAARSADQATPSASSPRGFLTARQSLEAAEAFHRARKAFQAGDYRSAQEQIASATEKMPHNQMFRQFSALCSFALGDYERSAEQAYELLRQGTAWDWKTLRQFYPNAGQYTQQYRQLQTATKESNATPHMHFLMAYHYAMLGHREAATVEFQRAQRQLPGDALIPQLLDALTAAQGVEPPPVDG